MKKPTLMPCEPSRLRASINLVTRVPLAIQSSTRWLPLSAPIQASAQPARSSAAAIGSVDKSARVWIVNGTAPSSSSKRAANAFTQSLRKPKMSSANQMWSGRKACFR